MLVLIAFVFTAYKQVHVSAGEAASILASQWPLQEPTLWVKRDLNCKAVHVI